MKEESVNDKLKKIILYINHSVKKKKRIEPGEGLNYNADAILSFFESHIPKKEKGRIKLPFKVKTGMKRYHKKNKLFVLRLKNNNSLIAQAKKVVSGTVRIDQNIHTIPPDSIMMWNGKIPCIFLPEWQITPFKPVDPNGIYSQSEKDKNIVDAQTYAIRAMKKESVANLMKRGIGKGMIWVIIGAAVLLYFFFGG